MSIVRSRTYMNITGVTVTPLGLSAIPITEVLDVQIIRKDGLEPWQADGHKFYTQLIAATGIRGITIIGGDIGKLVGLPLGTPCTVVAVINDSVNKLLAGALTVTLSNGVIDDTGASGPSNKFAGGTATFMAFSSDGNTDPLTVVESTAQA